MVVHGAVKQGRVVKNQVEVAVPQGCIFTAECRNARRTGQVQELPGIVPALLRTNIIEADYYADDQTE